MATAISLAVESLASDSPHERLKAARVLAKQGGPTEVPAIKAALKRETVSWVRRALLMALEAHGKSDRTSQSADQAESTTRDIKAEVMHELTRTLLHEFEPIIGVLKMQAEQEVPNYQTSNVKLHIDQLDSLVDAIRTLKKASTAPQIREFDLARFIKEVVAEQTAVSARVSVIGPDPMMVESDQALLRLALTNGLRNAIEATTDNVDDPHAVTVTWGATDVDVWITILDQGTGIANGAHGAFEIGRTTKKGHSGMGLPIAKQAMDSLEGEISLSPNTPSGARFDIRWFKARQQ